MLIDKSSPPVKHPLVTELFDRVLRKH
jgi:hypothetical protein